MKNTVLGYLWLFISWSKIIYFIANHKSVTWLSWLILQYLIRLYQFSGTLSSVWSRISAIASLMWAFKCFFVSGLRAEFFFTPSPQKIVPWYQIVASWRPIDMIMSVKRPLNVWCKKSIVAWDVGGKVAASYWN